MYTSYIGKRFLAVYNKKNKLSLTAKQFFENELFPIFYDSDKYLQSPTNTPLFQLIAHKKTHLKSERIKKRDEIYSKIAAYENNELEFPDMSFAVGFPSADMHGTTSGQISSLTLPFNGDDLFASWIGATFGIGLQGGYNILSDNEIILNAINEGWKIYREYVNQTEGIDNKIESWNSVWLPHRLSKEWVEENPRANFFPFKTRKGEISLNRSSWVKIIFILAQSLSNELLTIYAYSLGQMNKTIGFIQLKLPELKRFSNIYNKLFTKQIGISNEKLTELYESEYGFNVACEKFSIIGLRAIEPKDLKKYMPNAKEKGLPKLKDDEKSIINYSIYITWVIAMLNNEQLLELAEKTAVTLKEFVSQEGKVRTNRTNAVEKLLGVRNRKEFIDNITEIVNEDISMSGLSNELVNKIMLEVAPDQVPLFVTLLRFKYLSNNKL